MSELQQFRLPDVGEGLTEAEILSWKVRPGDIIEINQPLVDIETAKAVVEVPSPFAGTVVELLAAEGTTVDVGVVIITVAAVAQPDRAIPAAPVEEPAATGDGDRAPVLVGYGVTQPAPSRRRKAVAVQHQAPALPEAAGAGGDGVLASPPARKMARDLGVDLSQVTGTGRQGAITRDDIRQAAVEESPVATVTASGDRRDQRTPVRGVRRRTAEAMVRSAFTAPHVTAWVQADVTESVAAVARLREMPDFAGLRVSPLLLVARALVLAARRHPMINASWDEPAQEIVVKPYVHLGIAAATPRGLLVPNVKDADLLSLPDLARALGVLTATAREGRATPRDLSGGTITLSNVGVFGMDGGTPIINPGESAILSLGRITDAAWVHEGQLAVRKVTTLALSFDHRVVDGELASAVLRDIDAMLTDPLRMLAWS